MADDTKPSFLSRWSQRKAQARGTAPPEPPVATPAAPPVAVRSDAAADALPVAGRRVGTDSGAIAAGAAAADGEPTRGRDPALPASPTMDDVARLGRQSDYSRFVGAGVDARVRNAAMKKLFTDPHFNVMDGLDIYIGDYSQPDPIPLEMLRSMTQSKTLGLFDTEEPSEDNAGLAAEASPPEPAAVARSDGVVAADASPQEGGDSGPPAAAGQAEAGELWRRTRHEVRKMQSIMTTLICNCNRTMPLDGAALTKALGPAKSDGLQTVHSTLCRREAGSFQRAAKSGEDLLVACTQESRLFLELNDETAGAPGVQERPIRFLNIRETGGWSKDAAQATPKIAALIAAAQLPASEPVATVAYRSAGRLLVIGQADAAQRAAAMVADKLEVSLLLPRPGGTLPQERLHAVHAGALESITGWLGAFQVAWQSGNPIDPDLCTRCNACIEVCPDNAIDFSYQIDLAKCGSHRECVRVCEAAGAIDFARQPERLSESFDLVIEIGAPGAAPHFSMHQPPQGYFHVADDAALVSAVLKVRDMVGEFEKPKFFDYKLKLCAHSRNEQVGCSACIDVCSAEAITSERQSTGGIRVEPFLCVGCGACTTVCPSGALGYTTPAPAEQGLRLRTLLSTFRKAGGRDAALLLHSREAGARLVGALGRLAAVEAGVHGVPARVLPVDVWHTASVGMDLWLAAIAHGASQVWVLMTDEEAPDYRAAVQAQMDVAQAILAGLGYAGRHLRIVSATDARALDAALRTAPAQSVSLPGSFGVQAEKRATLDLALDHLLAQAPQRVDEIALSAPSPFGAITVDTGACTLCLACVGACPEGALADNPDQPQLRFIEKNCVQCGLCASTCPEDAIRLQPRLLLAEGGKARKQPRVLNEAQPYGCIRCGKPFGTLKAVELVLSTLRGHAMFQGAAAERLKMCSDCRVIDLHTNPDEVKVTDL